MGCMGAWEESTHTDVSTHVDVLTSMSSLSDIHGLREAIFLVSVLHGDII